MLTRRQFVELTAALGSVTLSGATAARADELRKFPGQTVKVLASSGHRQFNPVWDKLNEFQQKTGIDVSLTRVPTGDIRQKILQDLVMGAAEFDVLEILDDTISGASQYLTALDPYVEKDFGSIKAWQETTVPWATKVAALTGKLRVFPYYCGMPGAAYRETLFLDPKHQAAFKTKFGHDMPTPPKTWAEFVEVAQYFTRADDGKQLWGAVTPGKEDPTLDVFECFAFQEGVTHLDDDNHSNWGPKHPENWATIEAVAKFLQDMLYTEKVLPPTVPGMATNEATDTYINGGSAMTVDLTYFSWSEIVSPKVKDRIGKSVSFNLPTRGSENKGGIPFYWMWGIADGSKVKDAAWEFLRWTTSEDNLKLALTKGIGVFVPTNRAVGTWAAEQNLLPPAIIPAIEKAQIYKLNPQIGVVRETLRQWVEKLWLNQVTPAEFREGSGKEIEDLMVNAGLAK
jgi:multiple sugar transport system substrate-binding protein